MQQLLQSPVSIVLVLLAVLIILYLIARVIYLSKVVRNGQCPKCLGTDFFRSHRRWYERLLGYGSPVRRYRCANPECKWEGLRFRDHRRRKSSRSHDLPASKYP